MGLTHQSNQQQVRVQTSIPGYLPWQRALLATCIVLAPLSITLYLLTWEGNLRQPLVDAAAAGDSPPR